MKLRTVASFIIFSASYLPLSMILLAQNYEFRVESGPRCWDWIIFHPTCKAPFKNPGFAFPFFFWCLTCLMISMLALRSIRPKIPIQIKSVKHTPTDLMNYVLPYVVSFMNIDYQETGKFLGFAIFMGWMFWIINASGQVILNPLLTVFKWQLYEITYTFPGSQTEYTGRALSKVVLGADREYLHSTVQDVVIIKEPPLEG